MYVIYSIACFILVVLTLILFKLYGKNINQEETPYVASIPEASDFIAYEKKRPLTEEEYLEKWEKEQHPTTIHEEDEEENK
jgi:hypothetical protein